MAQIRFRCRTIKIIVRIKVRRLACLLPWHFSLRGILDHIDRIQGREQRCLLDQKRGQSCVSDSQHYLRRPPSVRQDPEAPREVHPDCPPTESQEGAVYQEIGDSGEHFRRKGEEGGQQLYE